MAKLALLTSFVFLMIAACILSAPTDNNYNIWNPIKDQKILEFRATLNFTETEHFPPIPDCSDKEEQKKKASFLTSDNKPEFSNFKSCRKSPIPEQFQILDLQYNVDTEEIHYIKITPRNEKRYEVPTNVLRDNYKRDILPSINGTNIDNYFRYTHEPVALVLRNPDTREEFLSIGRTTLVFRRDYVSFDYQFSSDFISGYGERAHNFKLAPGLYTTFTNDTGLGSIDDDGLGGRNLYGHQPFILHRTDKGSWAGILFFNSNAQDLVINKPDKWGKTYAEQRTIGGILEMFAWTRNTPLEVIRTYHSLVGKPALPNFWALGWHQCKYGYKDQEEWVTVVQKYNENEIPLDTMWLDIDYMKDYKDFTVSKENYGNLTKIVDSFHNMGIQVVPILDIGIPNDENDKYNKLGLELGIFVMSNYTNKPLVNKVWPGKTHFPDFTHPLSGKFWKEGLKEFKTLMDYDGLWLDMNEPGMINSDPVGEIDAQIVPEKNMYQKLYYYPGNERIHLERHTISINALMYGDDKSIHTMYNQKPLNPYGQNKVTNEYIASELDKRPFILSRSNFVGMGKYSAHWLGDNHSTFNSMRKSIPGIMTFSMFGFNLVGSDVCGFLEDTTENLCARWHNLGTFYPFARNHNNLGQIDQHPYNIGEKTLAAVKRTLNIRYAILRYMYSEHFLNSVRGGVVFQPLVFQFPSDEETINHLDEQVMIGPSFMLCPALNESIDDFDAYIPNSNWNSLIKNGELNFMNMFDYNKESKKGKTVKLSGSYSVTHLFFRGGRIIPLQYNNNKVRRSRELKNLKTTILVNPDHEFKAEGDVVYDDERPDTLKTGNYIHVHMKLTKKYLAFDSRNKYVDYLHNDVLVDKIVIIRINPDEDYSKIQVKDLYFDNINFTYSIDRTNSTLTISFTDATRIDNLRFVLFNNTKAKSLINLMK